MNILRQALDDLDSYEQEPCGKCASCIGHSVVDHLIEQNAIQRAVDFIEWAGVMVIPERQGVQEGRALSRYGEPRWGNKVAHDKTQARHFRDELVEALAMMIQECWRPNPMPQWVCCVPSAPDRSTLVLDFAQRLADRMGLSFFNAVSKTRENTPQREQRNAPHQYENVQNVFQVRQDIIQNSPVLLVDDVVDSGWTLTTIGILLRQAGSGPVYPVTLADSSTRG